MAGPLLFLDAFPLAAIVVGTNDRILEANTQAETLLGQGLVGRHYVTMLRQPPLLDCIEATLRDKRPREEQYLTNDGAQDMTYKVTCRFVDAFGGLDFGAVVVSFEDQTPLKQANRMRRDFVANVSHELRTPLTAMMGFIETLQGPARDDAAARDRFLGIMQTEAARMNRLVGDLLSLSRVEELQRLRPTESVVITDILTSTVRTLSQLAKDNGVEVMIDLPNDPVTITGDADQLRQVFTNLIENALKYGGSGERVDLKVRTFDQDPALRGPSVRVTVTDHGAGIDPLHLPRLTERFYRADAHRSRDMGGTGLGLAIVKHILTRHRGRLRVESDLGKGATFTVILPA
jgi:two-component system phosphate regulon sensor histidine kinase PhoR